MAGFANSLNLLIRFNDCIQNDHLSYHFGIKGLSFYVRAMKYHRESSALGNLSIMKSARLLLPRGTYGIWDDRAQHSVARTPRGICPPVSFAIRKSLQGDRLILLSPNFAKSDGAMKPLFWFCLVLITYTYFGYAVWLWLSVRLRRRPILQSPITPSVSVIIAARNEEASLPAKLENLRRLDYPPEQLQIIVASDGSTDRTANILREQANHVVPVILTESNGKACALNEAVKHATGDIMVFLDARQTIDANAVSELVACFADPEIGAASGELLLEAAPGITSANALGIYWKIEKVVRKLESSSGSVIGVTGAIYAIRREHYREIPRGTILDDVFVPMNVARIGKRVVFQPSAIARDRLFSEKGKEFSRKVRTLTGNYQLLRLAPWLLSPANPLLFRFVSHKLLRLLVPLLLILMLVASAISREPAYRAIFWLQMLFYVLAILGTLNPSTKRFRPVAVANTFVMLNAAAALAFYNFVAGRNRVWV